MTDTDTKHYCHRLNGCLNHPKWHIWRTPEGVDKWIIWPPNFGPPYRKPGRVKCGSFEEAITRIQQEMNKP